MDTTQQQEAVLTPLDWTQIVSLLVHIRLI
jgi:hypothetical protein